MGAFCHGDKKQGEVVCKGRRKEQMQNKRHDGGTVRADDAQRQLSWSWLSFLMSEDMLLLPLGPFNRLPIFLQ